MLLDNILFVEKDCNSNTHEDRDKRRGKTGNEAFTHANGKEQAKGEDDGGQLELGRGELHEDRTKQGGQQELKRLNDKLGLLLEHLPARKAPRSKDDGDGHAQRGDNASLIRPRLHSGNLLCNHGAGDAEIVDIAGNEGHVCPGEADDQEIGNGLHKSNHSNGTRDGQKAAENGRSRRHESEDEAGTSAGEKQRSSPAPLVMRPHLMMKGRYSFSYMA